MSADDLQQFFADFEIFKERLHDTLSSIDSSIHTIKEQVQRLQRTNEQRFEAHSTRFNAVEETLENTTRQLDDIFNVVSHFKSDAQGAPSVSTAIAEFPSNSYVTVMPEGIVCKVIKPYVKGWYEVKFYEDERSVKYRLSKKCQLITDNAQKSLPLTRAQNTTRNSPSVAAVNQTPTTPAATTRKSTVSATTSLTKSSPETRKTFFPKDHQKKPTRNVEGEDSD